MKRGTNFDVLAAFGLLIKNSKRMLNTGLTAESAAQLIKEDKIDVAAIGRPFMASPDFVKRTKYGKALGELDWAHLYANESGRVGYNDYPEAEYASGEN